MPPSTKAVRIPGKQIVAIDPDLLRDIHENVSEIARNLPSAWKRLLNDAENPETTPKVRLELIRYLHENVAAPYVAMAAQTAALPDPFKIDKDQIMQQLGFEYLMKLRAFLESTKAPEDLVSPLPSQAEVAAPSPKTSDLVEPQNTESDEDSPLP